MKTTHNTDYLSVSYNQKPFTAYPNMLAKYLTERLQLVRNAKVCEIGCGRGEFLRGFKNAGCIVSGTDMCASSHNYTEDLNVQIATLGDEPLPFADNTFDVVFSKSLLEHLSSPECYMKEALRILKPGGSMIIMTPDWESCHKIFYDDYTHIRPYTIKSLYTVCELFKLESITVEKFYQLPIVWEKPYLKVICRIIAPFIPVRGVNIKFLRWSRELMLLAIAKKQHSI